MDETWIRGRLAETKAGDVEAFGELAQAMVSPLRGFIAMLGVSHDEVDDVTQEAFLQAYRNLDKYDGSRAFGPWLRGIARNFVLRHRDQTTHRQRLRKRLIDLCLEASAIDDVCEPMDEQPRLSLLQNCLGRLSDGAARLVRMRYFDNQNSKQIGAELEQTPERVRVTLGRIRGALRTCIEQQMAVAGGSS